MGGELTDALEAFGIKRLSCSSLSKWQADRGKWLAGYIHGLWDSGAAAMWRGKAVESGLEAVHLGKPLDFARKHAMDTFEADAQGETDDGPIDKERGSIIAMLDQSLDAWEKYDLGPVKSCQQKTKLWLDDIPVPLIGYLDFALEGRDMSVDLKTTHCCPSNLTLNHAMQIGSYAKARGEDRAGILYVTTKKHAYFEIGQEEIEAGAVELRRRAIGLVETLTSAHVRALASGKDAKSILSRMCMPDPDSFYWDDAALAEALEKIPEWS